MQAASNKLECCKAAGTNGIKVNHLLDAEDLLL